VYSTATMAVPDVLFDREENDINNNNNNTAAAAAGFCASENVDSKDFVNREKRKTPSSSSLFSCGDGRAVWREAT